MPLKFRHSWKSEFNKGIIIFVLLVAVWQLIYDSNFYNPSLFPAPLQVGKAFIEMLKSGEWLKDFYSSILRYFSGFILGSVLGILIGIATGRVVFIREFLFPLFNFFRSIPSIALIPLAILWFGIGEQEKIFIITWGALFPVWLNTHSGVSKIEVEYIWAARSLGCNGLNLITKVYLPRATPFIIAGTRIAIATCFFSLAAAEMSGAFDGIAYRIFYSHQIFRSDKMLVAIFTIGFLSLTFDRLFVASMNYFFPWWKVVTLERS